MTSAHESNSEMEQSELSNINTNNSANQISANSLLLMYQSKSQTHNSVRSDKTKTYDNAASTPLLSDTIGEQQCTTNDNTSLPILATAATTNVSSYGACGPGELQARRQTTNRSRVMYGDNIQAVSSDRCIIRVGFLASFRKIGKLIAGAVPLATEAVNRENLLINYTLSFMVADIDNKSVSTIEKMTEMRERGKFSADSLM
ncbi:hypothetical protein GZH46_01932, partial [Fragariocoptes setiger]